LGRYVHDERTGTKIKVVDNRFCMSILASIGIATEAIEDTGTEFQKGRVRQTSAFVELCEDASFKTTKRYAEGILLSEEDYDFDLVCVSSGGIVAIPLQGMSEKEEKYFAFGSSELYGEYIIRLLYTPMASFAEAAKWAIYAIKQATLMDRAVGGRVQLAFVTSNGVQLLIENEVSKIEREVSTESPEFQRDIMNLVDRIVDTRRQLNQSIKKCYGFSPFSQLEAEVWALAHPVVTEQGFPTRILVVGILIDEMIFENEGETKTKGSIDALDAWLVKAGKSNAKTGPHTAILCRIPTLRNMSFLAQKKATFGRT